MRRQSAIAKTLRGMAENEQISLIAQIISANSLRDAWQAADHAIQLIGRLRDDINDLRAARAELRQIATKIERYKGKSRRSSK